MLNYINASSCKSLDRAKQGRASATMANSFTTHEFFLISVHQLGKRCRSNLIKQSSHASVELARALKIILQEQTGKLQVLVVDKAYIHQVGKCRWNVKVGMCSSNSDYQVYKVR